MTGQDHENNNKMDGRWRYGFTLQPPTTPSASGKSSPLWTDNMNKLSGEYPGLEDCPKRRIEAAGMRDQFVLSAMPYTAFSPLQIRKRHTSMSQELRDLEKRGTELKRTLSNMTEVGNVDVESFLDGRLGYLRGEEALWDDVAIEYRRMYLRGDIDAEEMRAAIRAGQEKQVLLLREKNVIRSRRRKLSGYMVSIMSSDMDRALGNAISHILGPTNNATLNLAGARSNSMQESWKRQVRLYYHERCPWNDDYFWCPFTRGYQAGNSTKVAHIIPRSMPGKLVLALMGRAEFLEDGQEMIWDHKNGIPMSSDVETAFDKAQFVIVPLQHPEQDQPVHLKMVILDPKLLKESFEHLRGEFYTWEQAQNQELIFQHPTNRPGMKYLCFHCIASLLRREFYEPPGWWRDLDNIGDLDLLWSFLGPTFRRGTLQHLLHLVGKRSRDLIAGKRIEDWLDSISYEEDVRLSLDVGPAESAEILGDELLV